MSKVNGMYGKHFASMYEGSMLGSGSVVFAVWGYVIAKQVPSREYGSWVELNPELLAFVLGEKEDRVREAIEFLCSPDPKTRTKKEEGRRLIRVGEYAYQVVNGAKYRGIRDEEDRRRQNREAKRRERDKKRVDQGVPLPGERAHEAAARGGDERGVAIAQAAQDATAEDLVAANERLLLARIAAARDAEEGQ